MNILVFAGTSEGRKLAQFLSLFGLAATIYVATEYGELLLEPMPHIKVCRGRLSEEDMRAQIPCNALVIDATHPYAEIVTRNIQSASQRVGADYIRLVRPQIRPDQPMITVPNTEAAATFLNTVTGSVLLTTGSKELETFTKINRFAERLYPRVLPTVEVLRKCMELGFRGKSIIAMQGPFTHEMNVAMLHSIHAKYLVTKDSGTAGGFAEKLSAAKEAGATVVLIARPMQEKGMTLEQIQTSLKEKFALSLTTGNTMRKFPLFVSLERKRILVIGGGHVANRRIKILHEFGADITLVAPEICEDIDTKKLKYRPREYQENDLQGAFLVIAATNKRETNAQIARDCRKANILCSVSDCAEDSTFYFPAVCFGNGITAGVVSGGTQHAETARIASRIREMLQGEVHNGTN